ncbi:MAG: BlaI/MecI/CopY family transcriptional regulator [Candidatus Aminicenantes bacterium]|jgi:predicted transcriptional regulator
MPNRKDIPELSKAEYDILRILWKDGRLTIREVHDQVYAIHKWAYTTTKTIMDRMIKKGLLEREKYHGIFLYSPLISRPAGLARMVRFFADRVLETDIGSVVSIFAKSNTLSAEEIEELESLLEKEMD